MKLQQQYLKKKKKKKLGPNSLKSNLFKYKYDEFN